MPDPAYDVAEIRRTAGLFLERGQVTEVRAFDAAIRGKRATPGTVSGYFDDVEALVEAVQSLSVARGVYLIPNPVNPALLARSKNRMRRIYRQPLTTDADVIRRRWLLIDLDPVRPAGISSTGAEKHVAQQTANQVREYLTAQGWPEPLFADSGNGFHLVYRVDLPPDDGGLLAGVLRALQERFGTERVHVDTTTHNPARIWKLYGTLACKGDNTVERPHRPTYVFDAPALQVVPVAMLRALVDTPPAPAPAPAPPSGGFDLEQWIHRHGLSVSEPRPWKGTGQKWIFNPCPCARSTTDGGCFLGRQPGGQVVASCRHDHCSINSWHDLRDLVEPGWRRGTTQPPPVDSPYSIAGGRIWVDAPTRREPDRKQPVADFVACITEESHAEDGEVWYTIEGQALRGGAFRVDLPAVEFAEDRRLMAKLEAAAGARSPVHAGMHKHLRPAIKLLTNGQLRHTRRYERVGWCEEGRVLIPGRVPPGTTIALQEKRLPFHASSTGGIEQGREALRHLILSMGPERTTVGLAFILGAPFARLSGLQDERYCLFIKGRTGSLKTTWVQTAMTLYGQGFARDDALIRFGEGTTTNALMALAAMCHDFPLFVDNYKPNTGTRNDIVPILHAMLEGGEKARLNRDSRLRTSKDIHCWPLFTGEDLPDTDAASLARVLAIEFAWQRGESNPHLTYAQRHIQDLQRMGWEWLEWIETPAARVVAEEIRDRFDDQRDRWATHLRRQAPESVNILRIAGNLATCHLMYLAATRHPVFGDVLLAYGQELDRGLRCGVSLMMGTYTTESMEAVRFLSVLNELLTTRRAILLPRGTEPEHYDADRIVGWYDPEPPAVYLLLHSARSAVERMIGKDGLNGITNKTLAAQLQQMGHAIFTESGRPYTSIRPYSGASPKMVLRLHPAALDEEIEQLEAEMT